MMQNIQTSYVLLISLLVIIGFSSASVISYARAEIYSISLVTLTSSNPDMVKQFLNENISVYNNKTGSSLSHYVMVPAIDEKSQNALPSSEQQILTAAYQDRYGRNESNDNLNIFLKMTYAGNTVKSIQGIELGSDSIIIVIQNRTTALPNSVEIKIPQNTAQGTQQKMAITFNPLLGSLDTPKPVLDFLNSNIDLVNSATGEHVTHYVVLQDTRDVYAQNVLGINNQNVTTIAFDDRYGRNDSNNDLNVFLQISHTGDKVNSIRGITLDDEIKVFVNGVDEKTLTKSIELWASSNPTSNPTPNNTSNLTTSRQSLSLLFVQYPSTTDAPQVQQLMHRYLVSPSDYIQVEKNNLYQNFTLQRKLMVADSIQGIQGRISAANTIGIPIYAITYDFEHWPATPNSEQADPFGSMNAAADAVHAAGYKFGYAPDSKFLNDNYKAFDWKKVDVAWLQVGYNARQYSNFVPYITDVINTIKTKNPNSIIIVQLSLLVMNDKSFSDPVSQFNSEVDIVNKLKADAISVVYLDPIKSTFFTISNLQAILSHISALRQ